MSSWISAVMVALPGAGPRDRQRQYNRNPARCQPITVSGFTISSTSAQRDHTLRNAVQNNRSIRLSLGRERLRFRTATCWRKARISRARSVRPTKKTRTAVTRSRMNRSMNLTLYHRARSLILWLGRVLATDRDFERIQWVYRRTIRWTTIQHPAGLVVVPRIESI
jgi:glycogen debranching enzyme